MAVLGKDLLDFGRPRTHTKVQFGELDYWVEFNVEPQPYGAVLTEILNLDVEPFLATLDTLEKTVQARNYQAAPRAFMDLLNAFASLPLYRLYLEDWRFLGSLRVEEFVVGEARDAFAESIIDQTYRVPGRMRQCLEDIRFIQRRYGWFLDSLFDGVVFEKKKGQRKEPLAEQITKKFLEAFVSGVSLGEDCEVDAPPVNIQYAVLESRDRAPELVEKMYFDRILDFVYVEFMKGLQKGFVPKRCANCGRWFLQQPGATYTYCDSPAPGQKGKTCREIGATSSFQDKVKNNDVWKIHQRAYKKYFARARKGTMSRTEFEIWAREAEVLRDKALEEYVEAESTEQRNTIVTRLELRLNCR